MNCCDYLGPALAWTGVEDSGRGISAFAEGVAANTVCSVLRHPEA